MDETFEFWILSFALGSGSVFSQPSATAALSAGPLSNPLLSSFSSPSLSAASRLAVAGDRSKVAPQDAEELRHYLLVCYARSREITFGTWFFSLESITGEPVLDAHDDEHGDLNRLSLLAAVRGLEAIDGRGLVSLISNNRYLIRSLDRSLPRWRENDFVWEQFGRKTPVQNADLWRRIDRTLAIHNVTASLLQTTRVSSGDERFNWGAVNPHAGQGRPQAMDVKTHVGEGNLLRFDDAHAGVSAPKALSGVVTPSPPAASPKSAFAGNRAMPIGGELASGDGLRRWLAGNCDDAPVVARRGRYRAADLADT